MKNLMKSILVSAIVVAALSLTVSTAPAAVVVYDTQVAFLAKLTPGYYLEPFNTGAVQTTFTAFGPTNAYGFTASSASNSIVQDQTLGGGFLTTSLPIVAPLTMSEPFTISFANSPTLVTAFGANFFDSDFSYNFISGNLTIALNDGTSSSITGAALGSFRGFTSDTSIASFTVTATTAGLYPSLDNLYVGSAIVPEPASLLVLALCGVVVALRRRRTLGS